MTDQHSVIYTEINNRSDSKQTEVCFSDSQLLIGPSINNWLSASNILQSSDHLHKYTLISLQ